MKFITSASVCLLTILFVACGKTINDSGASQENHSSIATKDISSSALSSSSGLSKEERNASWMKDFGIDIKIGDSLYGLTVTSIDPPQIHVQGEGTIQGTLEWRIFYDLPMLFFLPDVSVPEKFQRDFIVGNSDIFPIRQGAKVKASVEDMTVVFMESNMPSGVLLKTVEVIGEPYESISETSPEWKYYLELKSQEESSSSVRP